MSELDRVHRMQLLIRTVVWIVALSCLAAILPSCRTLKNAPADAALLGGAGASIAAGTMIGGPAGGAVAVVGTIASAVATEELVRPAVVSGPSVADIVPIPDKTSPTPPWWLSPNYWWAVILLALAVWFLVKLVFGARFRGHIQNAVHAFMSGQIKAGFAYLMAAAGMIHSEQAKRQEPQE